MIVDTVIQNEQISSSTSSRLTYFHDLNDNGFILGSAESASLSINLYDDADLIGEGAVIVVEAIDFDTDGVWGTFFGSAIPGWTHDLEVNTLVALNADGILNVRVLGLGDFWVGNSVLTVNTVSEPGTFALLGLGLIGLGFSRRKQSA